TGAANDSGYVLSIGGTAVYSAAAGQQVDKAQIAAAINSNSTVSATVKANYDSTSGVLTLESKNTGAAQSFTIDEYYSDGSTRIASDAEGFFASSAGTVTKNGVDASVTVTPTSTGVAATTTAASNTAFAIGTGVTMDLKAVGTTTATVNSSSTSSSTDLDVDLQIGANDGDNLRITLKRLTATALSINGSAISSTASIGSGSTGVLQKLDTAINSVSSARATMGAAQNRLENIVGTLTVQSENLTGAESRIRDVDMAQEMSTFTKHNILSQASQSMLAQANQGTQGVLSLLRG
ncbi:MAG TPA: flagellin, partial [Symbiobacteriaceae bacterium]|nr:flagellin [Symbiobacteriaceae bacterium]